jgi:CBS domain-containing protein
MHDVIERMEQSGYTALPLVDDHGRYAGTITEGDLLRKFLEHPDLTFDGTRHVPIAQVHATRPVVAVGIEAEVEELFNRALEQNFVPVVDSRGVFVGIVRRSKILGHCAGAFRASAR